MLVDGGSYAYNAADDWHAHFVRTASHNTVRVDDSDQMSHASKFTILKRAPGELVRFDEHIDWTLAVGKHRGYERLSRGLTHTRSVLMVGNAMWIVVDWLGGSGQHDARLHWLTGNDNATTHDAQAVIHTAHGDFGVATFTLAPSNNALGLTPLPCDVVSGDAGEPRGWLSRSYMQREAVASLAARWQRTLPAGFLSILGPNIAVKDWTPAGAYDGILRLMQGGAGVTVTIRDGTVVDATRDQ